MRHDVGLFQQGWVQRQHNRASAVPQMHPARRLAPVIIAIIIVRILVLCLLGPVVKRAATEFLGGPTKSPPCVPDEPQIY